MFAATGVELFSEYQLSMTIHQGVYHQVKRMLAAVGNKVEKLHRNQVGSLILPDLEEGEWMYLTPAQKLLSQKFSKEDALL